MVELEISEVEINPNFKTDVYEYTAEYIGEATKLNIKTKASDESYSIEIIGNSNLIEGENLVTILVSDEDGKNVATYQVNINKSLVDVEALAKEIKIQEQKKEKYNFGRSYSCISDNNYNNSYYGEK